MKKILVCGLVVGTAFVSCRRDRTCECEVNKVYTPFVPSGVKTDHYNTKSTKSDQRKKEFRYSEKCYNHTKIYSLNTPTLVAGNYVEQYICEIK